MLQEGRAEQPLRDRSLLPGHDPMISQLWPQGYTEDPWDLGGADLGGSLLGPPGAAAWGQARSEPHSGTAPGAGSGAGAGSDSQGQFCGASRPFLNLSFLQLLCWHFARRVMYSYLLPACHLALLHYCSLDVIRVCTRKHAKSAKGHKVGAHLRVALLHMVADALSCLNLSLTTKHQHNCSCCLHSCSGHLQKPPSSITHPYQHHHKVSFVHPQDLQGTLPPPATPAQQHSTPRTHTCLPARS